MDVSLLTVGDSFILRDVEGKHLHVIVAEMKPGKAGLVMLVYLSSSDSYPDETTILHPGVHPFVTKNSWVKYRSTKVVQRGSLEGKIAEYCGKVSQDMLDKIQNGLLHSKFTSRKYKETYLQWREEQIFNQLH